jgi:GTPase SAR1 family protein
MKIYVLGTKQSGKSYLSNYLAGIDAGPEYNPTEGVRILELKRNIRGTLKDIELWDYSYR